MKNLTDIYGVDSDITKCTNRINTLKKDFLKVFLTESTDMFSSSGRIEILGNHTDHNKGLVLVGAINKDILSACKKRNDGKIIIKSIGYEDISINISDTTKKESEKGQSISLIKGILKGFETRNLKTGGFEALLTSNIFKGAGVSSSAAYEVLICEILNYYYNDSKITALILAQISQYSESEYFGKPCGLLDQSGIAFGSINRIDFKDTETPEIQQIKTDFLNYSIIITNCGGDHTNLTHEYSSIKDDMQKVSGFFQKQYLREVDETHFYNAIPLLKDKVGGRAILRAIHFFKENQRVKQATNALLKQDIKTFLTCVNASGESSYKLLQNCYAQGDDYQGIPLALELSKQFLMGEGAVRVHGGGFAGTILAFVPISKTLDYTNHMQQIFGKDNVLKLSIRNIGTTKLYL